MALMLQRNTESDNPLLQNGKKIEMHLRMLLHKGKKTVKKDKNFSRTPKTFSETPRSSPLQEQKA